MLFLVWYMSHKIASTQLNYLLLDPAEILRPI
jgi:hypothetical protein